MTNEIIKRILIGIMGTVIFSILLAIFAYEPTTNRQPNSNYTSLPGLFIIYATYSGPFYIIAGIFWSLIIDKYISNLQQLNWAKYWKKFFAYIFAGLISSLALIIIYNFETNHYFYLGIIASLIYYHIIIIWEYYYKNLK